MLVDMNAVIPCMVVSSLVSSARLPINPVQRTKEGDRVIAEILVAADGER
jgi:hypothetical protein